MVLAFLLILVAGCNEIEKTKRVESAHPPVLLVVLDTVRADRVSSYGYERPTTPQLDAVAEAGVLFEDVTAPASWTWPSHASIFTGEPPWVHGAREAVTADETTTRGDVLHFRDMGVTAMRRDLPTLADQMNEAGYRTVSVAGNLWLKQNLGLTRGFARSEAFDGDLEVVDAARSAIVAESDRPLFLFVNLAAAHSPYLEGPGPWRLGDDDFLDERRAPAWVRPYLTRVGGIPGVDLSRLEEGQPMNAAFAYMLGELEIPEADLAKVGRLYDAGIRAADFGFGLILETWLEANPDGVVVVASDHGEALGERGLMEHRVTVYPEVTRVPLVIAAPGLLPAGLRVRTPVKLEAVHGTVLALAGVATTKETLLDHVAGRIAMDEAVVHAAALPNPTLASRFGRSFAGERRLYREGMRAVLFDPLGVTGFFDLSEDPAMLRDLRAERPEQAAALHERALRHFAEQADTTPAFEPLAIPEATRRSLQQLGYLEEGAAP